MSAQQVVSERSPRYHTRQIKSQLQEMINNLRDDVSKVDDPRAQALFETTAEVLVGLKKAFTDYEKRSEEAWR